jgi:hypothetical protein
MLSSKSSRELEATEVAWIFVISLGDALISLGDAYRGVLTPAGRFR